MNAIAEKIIKVVREELQSLHGDETGKLPHDDIDKVSYSDKMAVLRQFIRTIEGMERRGEFSEPEGLQRVVKDYLTGSHLENDSD